MDGQMNTQEQLGTHYVDVVMCVDATAGMVSIMEEVKQNVAAWPQRIAAYMKDELKLAVQLRVRVIAFRDFGDAFAPPVEASPFFALPKEAEAFRQFLDGIKAIGGCEEGSNGLEAIALALQSDWVKPVQGGEARHCIMVFTDKPALSLDQRSDAPSYPGGMPMNLLQLGTWWHGADEDSSFQSQWGRLVVFAPDVEPWWELQVWHDCRLVDSHAGVGLEEKKMHSVVQDIGSGESEEAVTIDLKISF